MVSRRTVFCPCGDRGLVSHGTTRGESHVRSQARDTRARFPGTGCSDLGDARRCRHGIRPNFGRAGNDRSNCDSARREPAKRSGVDQRVRYRSYRDARPETDGRLRQVHPRPFAGCARARRHDHRVPRGRLVWTPVRRRLFFRAISRRAADHAERPESRSPADRHRAARGAARASGHALRCELAVGHAAHHHQQAGSVRVRWLGRHPGHQCRRGRGGIRRERHVQCAANRGPPCAALRGVHRGGRRVHRQRPERKPAWSDVPRGRHVRQRRPGRRRRQ